ncbi:MAG: LptF/LptG family permease [Planctomycetes bacterium]|nr:LptF/LptG family permease [Planctomycetota bacterium]
MKILDRYIAKSFLVGYAIAFCVLIGMRILIDLSIQFDEFGENAEHGYTEVIKTIVTYYGLNLSLYFRDFAGMITVVAAAFSLSRMIRANELTAMMAAGLSLKRVAAPILLLSLLFTGVLVIDQEIIIPSISHKLTRSHDAVPGEEKYEVWFLADKNGSLICSKQYEVGTSTFIRPTIITRTPTEPPGSWRISGRIFAESATFNPTTLAWDLKDGLRTPADPREPIVPVASYYAEGLFPEDIPVLAKSEFKSLLSSAELKELGAHTRKDMRQLYSQIHGRITDPVINFVTLMVSLPALICRDPRSMKSAVMKSFALTTACTLLHFVTKLLAAEPSRFMPEFWAWLPVFIFLPIAVIELDSMKT